MKKIGSLKNLLRIILIRCSFLFILLILAQAAYAAVPVTLEAEACTLANGAVVATDVYGTTYPGYTGTGFVWVANAGTVTFSVTVPTNGMYEVKTRCWMYLGVVGDTRMQNISINGVLKGSFYIPNKGTWADFSFGYFYLTAGSATIEIGSSGSWGYILYDTVTFDYADMPDYNISATPCDASATTAVKTLKSYLTGVYGHYVISGQQEIYGGGNSGDYELEFNYIYSKTGKYPAIRGFDMMNYNPLYGWEDGTTSRIIDWTQNRGGIATICWHITIPIDFTSYTVGQALDWTLTSYKPNATFITANCLISTSKERAYLNLAMADLAEQLLILQNAGVAVILRPFHEAEGNNNIDGSGAWFWWGSGGATVYRSLWQLLYTTLTNTYGVHNALWEVNLYTYANSYQWYPGDSYVDMVAYDKYEGSPTTWGTSAATSAFLSLVNVTSDTKMVALSECDKIPDIQNIVNEGAWWLYFCPWYGSFILDGVVNTTTLLNTVYNSAYVLTLDELSTGLPTPTRTATSAVTPTRTATIAATSTGTATATTITRTATATTLTRTATATTVTRTATATRTATTRTATATRTSTTLTRTATATTVTRTATVTATTITRTATATATPTPGTGCSCAVGCSTITSITPNFSKDGAGQFAYSATSLGSYINSWNLTTLSVNGVNFTNLWVAKASLPATIGGLYYVCYDSAVSYGHFEAMN